ncbi:hypothetical protein, partial [Nitratifractor sp.]|uniref:hypothetical protein n=1 Tax=Nitratifractor sp. TaxID=2268144 RepID=UPI0025E50969
SKVLPMHTVEERAALNGNKSKEENKSSTVKRNQLIGGADVEWIEPQPREPGDKFGKPPI